MTKEIEDFDFDELNSVTWKDCAGCGQVFPGFPEDQLCIKCQYKQDYPEARDTYWTGTGLDEAAAGR